MPIETHSPLTNAKVLVNESVVTITDSSGYFCAIVNKKTLPSTIKVVINGNPIEYEIEQNKDSDFFISTGYFHDGKLDVME